MFLLTSYEALDHVSDWLLENWRRSRAWREASPDSAEGLRLPITGVVAGGALHVCIYQNRGTTEGIDVVTGESVWDELLEEAGEAIASETVGETNPIHCELLDDIAARHHPDLYHESVAAGILFYQSSALILYQASEQFQFAQKMHKMCRDINDPRYRRPRGVDLDDAIELLRRLVGNRNGVPLRASTIASWYWEECSAIPQRLWDTVAVSISFRSGDHNLTKLRLTANV